MKTRYMMLAMIAILFSACVKQVDLEKVTYDKNSTIIYSLDRNYTVEFPSAVPINNQESVVQNKEMYRLFRQVKILILKNKKRDAIIDSLEDKEKECL